MADAALKSIYAWHTSASAVPFAPKSAFPSVRISMLVDGQLRLRLLQKISNLRAIVGGGKDKGITSPMANGVKNTPYSSNLVPADSNSLVFARTPTQASLQLIPCLKTLHQYVLQMLIGKCRSGSMLELHRLLVHAWKMVCALVMLHLLHCPL